MDMIKTTVNGMRDITANEMQVRQNLLGKIREVYSKFGFCEISTPICEHIENLISDVGWENEKLIFKVLKRGEKLENELLNKNVSAKNLVDMGLRYDLTVPLCRYYANNRSDLPNPFKAMQIGCVYRADRPQKGRYREFMQCDIDVIGDKTNIAEIDLLLATNYFFNEIGFEKYNFYYEINNRSILREIQKLSGFPIEKFDEISIILDKMDKIGIDGVIDELKKIGIIETSINKYISILDELKDIDILNLKNIIKINDNSVDSLIEIIKILESFDIKIKFNPNLIRGMGYYTGTIYEIKSPQFNGSIGGGGRYDGLIEKWLKEQIPSVGISIGFERIITIIMQDFKNDDEKEKCVYSVENNLDFEKKQNLFKKAILDRKNGKIVSIINQAKNKKFQRESFENCGYHNFIDF